MGDSIMDKKCTGSFMFVFSAEWDYVSANVTEKYIRDRYSIPLSRRLDMIRAVEVLLNGCWMPYHCVEDITADSSKWSHTEGFTAGGDPTALWLYREFLFFSGKVRPLVYNICDYQKGDHQAFLGHLKRRKPPCVILERQMGADTNKPNRYLLLRKKDNDFILYSLPLTSIQLRLYASGVMNLSICCNNELRAQDNRINKKIITSLDDLASSGIMDLEEITVEDVAWIRDAGRRLFWPYGCAKPPFDNQPTEAPVYSALQMEATSIVLCDYRALVSGSEERITRPEYFEWTNRLICDNCVSQMKLKGREKNLPDRDLLVIHYFNDDRMYLHNTIVSDDYNHLVKTAWMHRNEITNANKNEKASQKSMPAPAEIWKGLKAWYAILAADYDWTSASCQDAVMLIRKCEEATDARWLDYGTFYGLYYNAMTQLITENAPDFLSRNMDWMYYQMFLLAIMQRSSVQRFYREASGAAIHRATHKAGKLSDALKEKYAFFMNSMWFTEVTEQEQGCDFFDMLQENMGLNQDMELLKDAIEELNDVTGKNLENAVNNALLPATFIGLALSAFDGLSHLFGTTADAETGLNAFSLPFPWALTTISCGIALVMWIYYLIRKR